MLSATEPFGKILVAGEDCRRMPKLGLAQPRRMLQRDGCGAGEDCRRLPKLGLTQPQQLRQRDGCVQKSNNRQYEDCKEGMFARECLQGNVADLPAL
jgi:hypothetical protein